MSVILPELPPVEFRRLVCGESGWQEFEAVGRELVGMVKSLGLLREGCRILDIGCGCGRVARFLLQEPLAEYRGFDRHAGMIEWDREHLEARDPRFRFDCFELRSVYETIDGVRGTINPSAFRFPYPDEAFDVVLAASVFTHMPAPEVEGYLGNIARILASDGQALVSIFHAERDAHRDDGLGFYLPPAQFEEACARQGLAARLLFAPRTGALHNWYLLKRNES